MASIYFKAIYQEYDWCYQKFMIEGLNHQEMANEAGATKRVIEKWCQEKHQLTQKYRQENKKFNNIQEDLIIGSLLGDGHIDKRETQPLFIVSHAENQKDYLFWKYELMKDFCNKQPSEIKAQYKKFDDKQYFCQKAYRMVTRIQDDLLRFRKLSKKELIDKLNNFSLSIWMLEDGYRSHSNWDLCIADFTSEEKEYIVDNFKNKFNLESHILKDDRYLFFNADSSRKIDRIILETIPNDLDIIKTKILQNNISKCVKRLMINYNNKEVYLSNFCKEKNINYNRAILLQNKGLNGEQIIEKLGV